MSTKVKTYVIAKVANKELVDWILVHDDVHVLF